MCPSSLVVEHGCKYIQSKHLRLRNIKTADMEKIYVIAYHREVKHLWAPNLPTMSLEKFTALLRRRIAHRWTECIAFENTVTGDISGFAYCYNMNDSSGTANVCMVMDVKYQSSPWCILCAYHYLEHLFFDCEYRKLYAEVHAYNARCEQQLRRVGFECEGTLKKHQLWNDQFWDMQILALTAEQFHDLCTRNAKLIGKLSCKAQSN